MSQEHHDDDGRGGHIHQEPTSFFWKYVLSIDHKMIGKQYLFTAMFFLLFGGMMALMMRWQIAYPSQPVPVLGALLKPLAAEQLEAKYPDAKTRPKPAKNTIFTADTLKDGKVVIQGGAIAPEGYTKLVTMHGSMMIFFVIIPILVGAFGNFLIPLHIGARDVAFPILNALSYWLFFIASVLILGAFFLEAGTAAAGWTSYPPLSALSEMDPASSSGGAIWVLSLFFIGFSSIVTGVNFLATIVTMRAPGMTWTRLPLVTWSQFITAVFQTLATPVLAAALMMLFMDQVAGTNFFIPAGIHTTADEPLSRAGGGHPLLWQHVFWFYSHPAVYILILPGMGIASDLLSTFARKPIFGYKAMVASMCGIMFLGFVVWGHHMFLSGIGAGMGKFFMTTTMLIALPSAIKVFNWLATMYGGSLSWRSPGLWAYSFIAMFTIGGLSGIFMAATPVDIPMHDTYYIVAHFHYVVFGGTLMAVFGGLTFWFPKFFGRMMSEFWAKVHWAFTFVAFNLTFFPMHLLGEGGHMRRIGSAVEKYEFLQPLQGMNVFITHAAILLGFSQLIFLANFFYSMFYGPKAEANPWRSNTLEWTTASPVPYHNYDRIPIVQHGPYEYNAAPETTGSDWQPQDRQTNAAKKG